MMDILSNNGVGAWILFMLTLLLFRYSYYSYYVKGKGPRAWPMVGMLPSVFLHVNDIYDWTTQMVAECEGTLKFKAPWMANMFSLVTTDPRNIEYVLKTKFGRFPKGRYYKSIFDDLLGDGILNIDGRQWERARKIMSSILHSPAFKHNMIRTLQQSVNTRLLPDLDGACRSGSAVDLDRILHRFGFHNMCMLGFGVDLESSGDGHSAIAQAIEQALDATVRRIYRFITPSSIWKTMRFLNMGRERKLKASMRTINAFVGSVITARRKELRRRGETERHDMLSIVMESNEKQDDKTLRDMILNFVLAGRDTTAIALRWFFCLLDKHPRVEENILSEIRRIAGGNCELPVEAVKEMHYLQAALSETLRLYPSLPINWKEVRQEEVLPDGTRLKKGSNLLVSIYSMGRMENIWGHDCLEFKPERWMREGVFVGEGGYKYPVFNAGPRACLGKDFALLQMKWVASSLLQRYRFMLLNNDIIARPKLGITLCPNSAVIVTLHPRSE